MEATGLPPQGPTETGERTPDELRAEHEQGQKDAADDIQAQLAKLQAAHAELEAKLASGQLTAAPPDEAIRAKARELRAKFADWPFEGGSDLPHPWDLRGHGLPQPGVTRDYLPPGPNELSPIVIEHGRGLVTSGMAGTPVLELAELLAVLGYPSSVSRGQSSVFAFDDSVAAALHLFRRDYGVKEDPTGFPTNHDPDGYVGPYVWEALLRAVARKAPEKVPLADHIRMHSARLRNEAVKQAA